MADKKLNQRFGTALKSGQIAKAITMIGDGADIDAYYPQFQGTPLNHAGGYPKLMRALLDAGADPQCSRVPAWYRLPALHTAVTRSEECTRILLESGVDANAICVFDGKTAARVLVARCDIVLCQKTALLVHAHGGDFTICADDGLSAADVIEGMIAQEVGRYPPSFNTEGIAKDYMEYFRRIAAWCMPASQVDRWSCTPDDAKPIALYSLARHGRRESVDRFLANGIVNLGGRAALQFGLRGAIVGGHLDLVDQFLAQGTTFEEDPLVIKEWDQPVFGALKRYAVLRELILRGAGVDVSDQRGESLLAKVERHCEFAKQQGDPGCSDLVAMIKERL
ncbi:MAG: hypothetical protein GC159_12940 [Phycisphaera sp.]|nr:hypothetical protein [Phycisphaera sp.]